MRTPDLEASQVAEKGREYITTAKKSTGVTECPHSRHRS